MKSLHGSYITAVGVYSSYVIAKDTYEVLKTHVSRVPPESPKNQAVPNLVLSRGYFCGVASTSVRQNEANRMFWCSQVAMGTVSFGVEI